MRKNSYIKVFWNEISIFNKSFFKKPFGLHVIWAIILLSFMIIVSLLVLNLATGHADFLEVPDVVNMKCSEAVDLLKKYDLAPIVTDSLYIENYKPNTVIRHIPDAKSIVKKNRNIFLIINRTLPPSIDFPDIIGMSYSNAADVLKMKGLYVSDTIYKDDIAKNTVLEHMYKNATIKAGQKIPLSSGVTLVLGNGTMTSLDFVWVPELVGRSFYFCNQITKDLHLQLQVVNVDDSDPSLLSDWVVIKQEPDAISSNSNKNKILQESRIKVWLQRK